MQPQQEPSDASRQATLSKCGLNRDRRELKTTANSNLACTTASYNRIVDYRFDSEGLVAVPESLNR